MHVTCSYNSHLAITTELTKHCDGQVGKTLLRHWK